jgi:hypothetical protein
MPEPTGASSAFDYDAEAIRKHVLKALTLIERHDVQDRASVPPVGRKTLVTCLGTWDRWQVRVVDAEPWKPGRPEHGEPRFFDLTITLTPHATAGAGGRSNGGSGTATQAPADIECCASGSCEVCAPGGYGGSRYWS